MIQDATGLDLFTADTFTSGAGGAAFVFAVTAIIRKYTTWHRPWMTPALGLLAAAGGHGLAGLPFLGWEILLVVGNAALFTLTAAGLQETVVAKREVERAEAQSGRKHPFRESWLPPAVRPK